MDARSFFEFFGGVAADDAHGLDVLHNDGAGADDGAAADVAARGENEDGGGKPGVVVDADAVVFLLPVGGVDVVGGGDDFGFGAYDDVGTDGDGIAEVDLVGLEAGVVADGEVAVCAAGKADGHDDAVADGGATAAGDADGAGIFEVLLPAGEEAEEVAEEGAVLDGALIGGALATPPG